MKKEIIILYTNDMSEDHKTFCSATQHVTLGHCHVSISLLSQKLMSHSREFLNHVLDPWNRKRKKEIKVREREKKERERERKKREIERR